MVFDHNWGGVSPNHTLIAKLHNFLKHYIHLQLGKLKKKPKKHLGGLSPQWEGGFWAESTFHVFCFTFNVKIMSKNWKRTIKQW